MIILRGDDAARFICSRAALNLISRYATRGAPLTKALTQCLMDLRQYDILSQNCNSALRALDEAEPDIIFARCPEGNDAAALRKPLEARLGTHIIDLSDISDIGEVTHKGYWHYRRYRNRQDSCSA